MANDVMVGVGGATYADVYAAQRERLHDLDAARRLLGSTEPLNTATFGAGDGTRFRIGENFNHELEILPGTHLVDAYVERSDGRHQMTKDAALEATSLIGISKGYAMRCPPNLLEPHLNYWFTEGFEEDKKFKVLFTGDDQIAAGMCRGTINPFSNLTLLDQAVDAIYGKYGQNTEILVDYKVTHNLAETFFRLIVPASERQIENTGTNDDLWCAGVQVRNSLIGQLQTEISGYLFRWICTNGAIDTFAQGGTWNRRGGQGDEVYAWAKNAVDEVLGGMEHSFAAVQDLTEHTVPEEELNDTLRAVFETFRIPTPLRRAVITNATQADGTLTMYSLMQAISLVANDISIAPGHVDALMRTAGEFSRASHHRCPECHHFTLN